MINYSVSPQVNPQNPEAAPKFYAKAQFVNNLDINAFARAFDLPLPEGDVLAAIKKLIRARALGVFVKYLQKSHKTAAERKQKLTWSVFAAVNDGYQLLAAEKKSDY